MVFSTFRTGRLLALAATLAGCAVGPDYVAPAAPQPPRYTTGPQPGGTQAVATLGGTAQSLVAGRDVPGEWWALFRSPGLTELVRMALAANPDVTAAHATLLQARETMRAEEGSFFPSLTANASDTRQRASLAAFGQPGGSITYTLYSASLNLGYSPDLFGGIRRSVENLGALAEYQRYELEATVLTLTANVVDTAITEASLRAQIAATEDIVRIYEGELAVLQRRFALGGVSKADVLQQQAGLAAAAANLPPLRKQQEQARHLLATYLGHLPGEDSTAPIDLAALSLPQELPLSVPSRLVEQRPDIQAAAAQLHAATAKVGVATANLLPQVNLTASYGREGTRLQDLFTPAGLVWSVAAAVAQPIFEGGALRADRRAAVAAMQAAAAQYSSTVNTAFRAVADALVALQRDAETLAAQVNSADTARQSLTVAQAQLRAGGGTYLNVLTAEQAYQSARLALVSAQAARFTDTVALFQALGGGWWNRNDVDPAVATCCGVFK